VSDHKILTGIEGKPNREANVSSYRPVSYDDQAAAYDQRVGFCERDCHQIAQAALSLAEAHPGDLVVEVGTGTGQIGRWFVREGYRYVGVDLSQGMLDIARDRMPPYASSLLIQADGNRPWPIADAAAQVIFSSRAIHLLTLDHVVHEVFRIAKDTHAVLIIGRVQRQSNSIEVGMKHALRRLLHAHGVHGHDGAQNQTHLLESCCKHGAQMLEPRVVSEWTVTKTPWQSIQQWQAKPGLGGVTLPGDLKQEMLGKLEHWAETTFHGLHQPVESEEKYVLHGVRLSPSRHS